MEIFQYILSAYTPMNLLVTLIGAFLGILVGAIPGLSSPMVIVVLLPLTYTMEPLPALLLLIAIYNASKLGGSFPAVLLRTPGTPAAACTCLDGHAMAEQGRAGEAIGYAVFASSFGGVFSFLACLLFSPAIAAIALKAASADIALIGILGLVMVCIFSRGNIIKGLVGVALGLLLSSVGADPINGTARYTFGNYKLVSGIPFVAALVGMFAIGTVLSDIKVIGKRQVQKTDSVKVSLPKIRDAFRYWKELLIGAVYGVIVGAIPGVGAEGSTWLAYANAQKISKHPEKFGTGIPEGIVAPEASNNAVTGGALIPMLTLGIPGDGSTAIMLGALMLQGLNPGVTLFRDSPALTYGMIAGLLSSTVFMFLIAWKLVKPFVAMLSKDRSWIFPFVIVFASIGAFADSNTTLPVLMATLFGLLAYFMQKNGFPIVTLVLAIILGPTIEVNARTALLFSKGSWSIFYSTWLRKIIILVVLYLIVSEVVRTIRDKKKAANTQEAQK